VSDIAKVTRAALVLGMSMALTPAVFTVGPLLESRFFPVVSRADIFDQASEADGVIFHVRFRKMRQCEFLGLAWYEGPVRRLVEFQPSVTEVVPVRTRPKGFQQAGPWRIGGLRSLRGTRAYALHRCHPLWITITDFFEG